MQLGIFMPTMSNGWVFSTNSPQFVPDWFLMEQTATKAEHYGFDFLLAPVKLRGFDGPTEPWNHTLDSFAVMAALAARTSRLKLYASVATLTTPPPLCAKQVATIQDIAGGRFGLNIVTGWEKPEYTQMGIWPGDQHFENRYDHATEYVQIMKELWATGRSDFKGEFFQMDDCMLGPKPTHPIELVCAGGSDRGIRFCAELGDYQFLVGKPEVADLSAQADRLLAATEKTGRSVGAFPLYTVVLRDSLAEAEDAVESWRANQDFEAVANMMGIASTDTSADAGSTKNIMLGSDGFMFTIGRIMGNAKDVAEQIRALSDIQGVSGMMLTFQDYLTDIDRFGKEVIPLLG
jgi:pyrimidine oxygenase